ncbi:hypothetical protein L7F22_010588 [Adiantum nelumboides]|nr:hypothetical protein [Adiantum nelumboides]
MAVAANNPPNSSLSLFSNRHMEFGNMEWYAGAEPRNSEAVATAAACFLPLYQSLDTYQHHASRTPMNCTAACDPASAPMVPTFQQQAAPVPILHTEGARPHQSRKRKMPLSDKRAPLHTLSKPTNCTPLILVDLNHAQARSSSPAPGHNIVSTGLCLASFDDDGSSVTTSSRLGSGPACIGDELAAQLLSQQNELQQLLKAHADHLQNALKERTHLHLQAFLSRVEDKMSRRLCDKDAELGRVKRHNSELEERINRLSLETHVWQSKARSYESMVSVLRANLQQAMLHQSREQVKLEGCGDSDADDAASAHIDETPDAQHTRAMTMRERKAEVLRACKRCRVKEVTVLLLPCMHLCVCHDCKLDVERCPICTTPKSAFIEINRECYSENHIWLTRARVIKYMLEIKRPLEGVFEDDDDDYVEVLPEEGKGKLAKKEDQKEHEKDEHEKDEQRTSEEMDVKRKSGKSKEPSSLAKKPTPNKEVSQD